MSTELGAISSYALAMQTVKIAAVKNSAEMQQMVVDMLLENTDNMKVAASETHGQNVDKSV